MSWLKCNGIELARYVSQPNPPSSEHRDIGNVAPAADGTTVATRIARKYDLKLTTRALSYADARPLESLLAGESQVFSFDTSLYSSKGFKPNDAGGSLEDTSPAPPSGFGGKYLRLVTDAEVSWQLGYDVWTVSAWVQNAATDANWHHYVVRSDGQNWFDGVLGGGTFGPSSVSFDFGAGLLAFTGSDPGPSNLDDVVASPFLWPDAWAPQVFRAGAPFGPAPFLTMTGDMVREAASRRMVCRKVDEKFMIAGIGGSLQRDVRTLDFDLAGV